MSPSQLAESGTATEAEHPAALPEAEPLPAARTGNAAGEPVLIVEDLKVTVGGGRTEAVHGVSFTVHRGETVGLVGESGSGKTLTCRAVLGLLAHGCATTAGRIELSTRADAATARTDSTDLAALDRRSWNAVRGTKIGAVFQDPASYLNPSLTVGRQLNEALRINLGVSHGEAKTRALELFASVGLRRPEHVYHQYPHELSGGMAQRVLIAIAISGDPDLLIADEATSSLDALVQAEVLDLLRRLSEERGLALLLVTHDLAVVAEVCDRVLVCYKGELVEQGPTEQIISRPEHPHTRALLAASL
ncbi:MAG TPA: ABC transporter ATP-binding protein [Actinocrinis sp.]|nr:ABC transporter ATP-binding protein [Actinocrinis sp.]